MNWWQALILGLIQGLTEFLPVSSSGHLAIGKELLGIEAVDDPVFEVVVHCATVLSTIIVFRKQIFGLLKGFFKFKYNDETDYLLKIAVSMIPVFVVGVFFKDAVVALFQSITVVGIALLVTALLLFLSDNFSKWSGRQEAGPSDSNDSTDGTVCANASRGGISYLQAFIVGLGQACAVIPGLSRSGTTIATGLISGIKRENMAQFSFLMVLIPILGETFLDLVSGEMAASATPAISLALGFAAAFASGLAACRIMIALVRKARLSWFAIYCAIVGTIVLIFS